MPIRPSISPEKALTDILNVGLATERYRRWTLAEIARNFFPAVNTGQYLIHYDDSGRPIAFLTFASFSDSVSKKLEETGKTPPQQLWNSGGNLWMMDFASPYIDARKLASGIRKLDLFKGKTAKGFRRDLRGKITRISEWKLPGASD